MNAKKQEQKRRRVRSKIRKLGLRLRLSVFRSNKFLYAQIIDDEKGITLVSASGGKKEGTKIGEELAKRAKAKKIETVVFDRGSYKYHGQIKALADGARKGGLVF